MTRVATISVELEECSSKCLFFHGDDGGGHCDGYSKCKKTGTILHDYNDNFHGPFPSDCPLEEKQGGDK